MQNGSQRNAEVETGDLVTRLVVLSSRLTRAMRRIIGNDSELVVLRSLAVIEQYQPVRVGHFAEAYLCSQPAATKLLARLEGDGYVVRGASATDRRASEFSLTESGRQRLSANRGLMIRQMEPYFAGLSSEERRIVDHALGLLSDYLDHEHPVGADDPLDPTPGQSSAAMVAPSEAADATPRENGKEPTATR